MTQVRRAGGLLARAATVLLVATAAGCFLLPAGFLPPPGGAGLEGAPGGPGQADGADQTTPDLGFEDDLGFEEETPAESAAPVTAADLAAEAARTLRVERGRYVFDRACAPCHGRRGDGRGPAAAHLDPAPRDFTRAQFKWRSTPSGALPTDDDILRTVTEGAPGTAMPAWRNLLSEVDRRAVVEYVLTFSPRFRQEAAPEPLPIPAEPPLATAQDVATGGALYERYECWKCHGREGRGDGPAAAELTDDAGTPITPFDFTSGRYRCGTGEVSIYRTFTTGVNGTPMPSFADTMPESDRWALVRYVRSLEQPPTLLDRLLGEDASPGSE